MTAKKNRTLVILLSTWLSGCGEDITEQVNDFAGRTGADTPNQQLEVNREILDLSAPPPNPDRNAYFGDLHVHTEYSFDAYSFGTTASPYDAYRYARGEALTHPRGYQIQLRSPLDFYAVTDHAMFLGLVKEAADTSTVFSTYAVAKPIHNINAPDNMGDSSIHDEATFFSKAGILDGSPRGRGSVPPGFLEGAVIKFLQPSMIKEVDGRDYIAGPGFETWSASGIAAVWAEENSREAIYDAFRRK